MSDVRTQPATVNDPLGYRGALSGTSTACCAFVNEKAWPEVAGANPVPPNSVPS